MNSINPLSVREQRVIELYDQQRDAVYCWTDRLFAYLLVVQWLAEIATALWISPLAWEGAESQIHSHVWEAVFLGFGIIALPLLLTITRPGRAGTRQAVAIGQALSSALLVHLTGGRIETHFHVFASLALLAFYRDWRVLLSATVVVAGDHFVRGIWWPQSVYGIATASPWRFVEHAGWVVMEDIFLFLSCRQGLREMWNVAERQARLEATNAIVSSANEQLRNEIADRQRTQQELEVAKEAAEAANRAKSEFLANMSHELRTPLNAIIGFSDVLAEQVFGPLSENQLQYVNDILESGQHLLSLVNDILDLAKIEAGSMEVDLAEVGIAALIERTVHIFHERAVRQKIRLTSQIEPTLDVMVADERRVKQLLFNLLSNAVKFTPAGGQVTVRARQVDGEVVISVADTGVGIPVVEQEAIFDTFYQVDSTLTKTKQGTGLGLALVRKIAELHDGRVWVKSYPGQGSEFFFAMPHGTARTDSGDKILELAGSETK